MIHYQRHSRTLKGCLLIQPYLIATCVNFLWTRLLWLLVFTPVSMENTLQWLQEAWGAPSDAPRCLSSLPLTILQGGDCLCLGAEVAVPDVIGGLHPQFVGGERVQAVEWGEQG